MQLYELRERILMLPALENRMESLVREIRNAEDDVSDLLFTYEQERRDVEQMQKENLSSFLLRLIGKYEDKLEKEQREEINAKLAYDRAVTHLNYLKSERDDLASRIMELRREENKFHAELAKNRQDIENRLTEPDGKIYYEMENERNTILSQIAEIKEALSAAARAKSTAQSTLKSLRSAESWATYDALTRGGIISHIAKYSHIDDAEHKFHVLSSQLRELKSELDDVQGLTLSGLNEISAGQRAVDFWFDNIFTDLSVRRQVKGNAEQISQLIGNIDICETTLKSRLRQTESELAENNRREEEFLISLR